MKRPAVITIRATQSAGDEEETTELVTEGTFGWQGERAFLTYQETVATGFEGDTTTLRIEGEEIQNRLTAEGGEVVLIYHIDCNHALLAVNRVQISVRLRGQSFLPQ